MTSTGALFNQAHREQIEQWAGIQHTLSKQDKERKNEIETCALQQKQDCAMLTAKLTAHILSTSAAFEAIKSNVLKEREWTHKAMEENRRWSKGRIVEAEAAFAQKTEKLEVELTQWTEVVGSAMDEHTKAVHDNRKWSKEAESTFTAKTEALELEFTEWTEALQSSLIEHRRAWEEICVSNVAQIENVKDEMVALLGTVKESQERLVESKMNQLHEEINQMEEQTEQQLSVLKDQVEQHHSAVKAQIEDHHKALQAQIEDNQKFDELKKAIDIRLTTWKDVICADTEKRVSAMENQIFLARSATERSKELTDRSKELTDSKEMSVEVTERSEE